MDKHTRPDNPDPHLWALELGPVYPGGPDVPVGAHLIVSSEQKRHLGEVRTAACGKTFTAGTHPKGWWSTKGGTFPLQDHDIHCGQDIVAGWEDAGRAEVPDHVNRA